MPELLEATYDAIRHDVAWRVVERDGVVVSGPGALDWLQGQVSQDIAVLAEEGAGETGLLTLVLSPQGKIESFCRICRLGADRYLLDVHAGFGEALFERLRRFKLRVKADLEPLENLHSVELRGPGAVAKDGPQSGRASTVATLTVSWPGWSGHDLLFVGAPPEAIDFTTLWLQRPSPAGADEAFEAARIEAGLPELGSELTERTIPQEAGDLVKRAVSFTKGCYTGQELVARIDARGSNTPRRLHGVVIGGTVDDDTAHEGAGDDVAPAAGHELRIDGEKVGELTSVAWSPGFRSHVALAYVKRGIDAPAQAAVVGGGASRQALVRTLPLFEG
jgi:folate-binding protein YgfZ